jgi:L-serine dehydratase
MGISLFEIIGPIMVGPSSSHTAGMARIGMMANRIIGEQAGEIHLTLSPKMMPIYAGHKSDAALIGGTIGMNESDAAIRNAIEIANSSGIETSVSSLPDESYPQNTARITVTCPNKDVWSITGTSIGGGSIMISEIDEVPLTVTADAWHLVVWSDGSPKTDDLFCDANVQTGCRKDGITIQVLTFADRPENSCVEQLQAQNNIIKIRLVEPIMAYGVTRKTYHPISSCEEALGEVRNDNSNLFDLAVRYEMMRSGFTKEAIIDRMRIHYAQMKKSVEMGKKDNEMLFNLTGGKDGKKMWASINENRSISKGIVPEAVAMALGVMEYNGSMGCLVAAPTAGSSGIIPGCMVAVQEAYGLSDEEIIKALFISALMGVIMSMRNVSFSGSVGGCQGEVGVSSSIAAAGLASLFSDDPDVPFQAMAMCMKNLLGLVCDPIAGPIEVPCIKRNAVGVANAYISADMALAGIKSYIPPDEVIDALVDVEKRLPTELKCGSCAGLASTQTAIELRARLAANQQ